ncbi:hypothetical protein D3C73_617220 [compost metagenome]
MMRECRPGLLHHLGQPLHFWSYRQAILLQQMQIAEHVQNFSAVNRLLQQRVAFNRPVEAVHPHRCRRRLALSEGNRAAPEKKVGQELSLSLPGLRVTVGKLRQIVNAHQQLQRFQ